MNPPGGRTLAAVLFVTMFLLIPIGQVSGNLITGIVVYFCYPSEWSPLCIDSVSPCSSGGCWVANVTNGTPSNITAFIVDSVQYDGCYGDFCPGRIVAGQTVGITVVTVNVPANGEATANLSVSSFPSSSGAYCMHVFAISLAGGSLSPSYPNTCFWKS